MWVSKLGNEKKNWVFVISKRNRFLSSTLQSLQALWSIEFDPVCVIFFFFFYALQPLIYNTVQSCKELIFFSFCWYCIRFRFLILMLVQLWCLNKCFIFVPHYLFLVAVLVFFFFFCCNHKYYNAFYSS